LIAYPEIGGAADLGSEFKSWEKLRDVPPPSEIFEVWASSFA